MANRTFLLLTYIDDPTASRHDGRTEIVVGANYMLPILWCSVFTADDVRAEPVGSFDEEGLTDEGELTCPALLTTVDIARQRAAERRKRFSKIFPNAFQGFYQEWLDLLDGIDAPYVVVSMVELWGMEEDPANFDRFLATCLRAFDTNTPGDWAVLIDQSWSMQFDPASRQVTVIAGREDSIRNDLHGYEWLRPVPWEE